MQVTTAMCTRKIQEEDGVSTAMEVGTISITMRPINNGWEVRNRHAIAVRHKRKGSRISVAASEDSEEGEKVTKYQNI
jgi:hypothetical protein